MLLTIYPYTSLIGELEDFILSIYSLLVSQYRTSIFFPCNKPKYERIPQAGGTFKLV